MGPRASSAARRWFTGELALWRARAGVAEDAAGVDRRAVPLELAGRPEEAAERWDALNCPYEAAVARADLDALGRLGARAAVLRLRRRGPRRPRASTPPA